MDDPWTFLFIGYAITVAIETPVLVLGLGENHSWGRRLGAGLWLTACTYPIVILVLPMWIHPGFERPTYLLLAETFAPAAECTLFWLAFRLELSPWRDMICITLANLMSFGVGEGWYWWSS